MMEDWDSCTSITCLRGGNRPLPPPPRQVAFSEDA